MASNYIKFYTFFDILSKHSDNDNMLSMKKILQMMEERTGDKIDRRTIYEYIKNLKELGFDISDYSKNNRGYFLKPIAVTLKNTANKFVDYKNQTKTDITIEFDNDLKHQLTSEFKESIDLLRETDTKFLAVVHIVYDKSVIGWILSFGSKAKVVEPPELKYAIKEEINKLNEIYS
ncbi:WYL domain-containing protein [Clostridium sp. YIM B02505]|uniref:WYL domain-containing protein n=1 Tax=Clostridium yunnanense TaxID=2800325 RepID=A0ABS1EJ71_9CLOT|nr:WYL domain-containing protein [Clostridium yunnanense]MBK1809407.1 WYL domain-containing protein [Clostridium yunnanense]